MPDGVTLHSDRVARRAAQATAPNNHHNVAAVAIGGGALGLLAWLFWGHHGASTPSGSGLPYPLPCPGAGWNQVSDPASPVGYYCTPSSQPTIPLDLTLSTDESLSTARLIGDAVFTRYSYKQAEQLAWQIHRIGPTTTLDYAQTIAAQYGVLKG